ncbi:uncharacterized protein LOC128909421 isoform X2 [Rissa tridactyla]|uniref:uncharacterized protein LOC128909421 isoform X2 n=1 Tax=Rissa tridactyla TaxID=75485 RepID=UPI0023BA649C|nr:uncharacterized protein LOC128909421 isoform X2 [Rissa tridactyla]XP_054057049.1 uncharacterized protein LOC128909421 isoform X2 [Rissa tridactyla]XP_054057050.1 uncharacterized protein LOC128909421 isoform X2 [Rissa tridactyla]XP_054057051.1 uncharacterized protein LOC128909421 isoform X2 [Rissa tridactyla]
MSTNYMARGNLELVTSFDRGSESSKVDPALKEKLKQNTVTLESEYEALMVYSRVPRKCLEDFNGCWKSESGNGGSLGIIAGQEEFHFCSRKEDKLKVNDPCMSSLDFTHRACESFGTRSPSWLICSIFTQHCESTLQTLIEHYDASAMEKLEKSDLDNWENIRGPRLWEDSRTVQKQRREALRLKTE